MPYYIIFESKPNDEDRETCCGFPLPESFDPAVRDRIEQLITKLNTTEDPAEKARVRAEFEMLIFNPHDVRLQ